MNLMLLAKRTEKDKRDSLKDVALKCYCKGDLF